MGSGSRSVRCGPAQKGDLQMEILQVKQIHKIYGEKENKVHALKDVSFTVDQGEFIAIVGTSGSGKSTLLNLIGGLDTPTQGQIIIRGHDIASLNRKELGLWEKRKRYPNELSGGQQQRTALARALANKPALILADEPTGNLDSATTVEVMGLLKESSRKYSQTILMVTHNEALAQACDRIIRIEDGRLYERKKESAVPGRTAGKGGDRS